MNIDPFVLIIVFCLALALSLVTLLLVMIPPTRQLGRKMGIISLGLGFLPFLLAIIFMIQHLSDRESPWLVPIIGLLPSGISRLAVFLASELKPPPVTIKEKSCFLDLTIVVLALLAVGWLAFFLLKMAFSGARIGSPG